MSILEHETDTLAMGSLKQFGELVRGARLREGLSAYELAARIERQPSFLSRLENGQNANPPEPAVLTALTAALGLSRKHMLVAMGYLEDSDVAPSTRFTIEDALPANDPRWDLMAYLIALDPEEEGDVIEALRGVIQLASRRRLNSSIGRKR